MSQPIIEIQGIGKRYRIGATKEPYLSLRDEVAKWLSPTARRARAVISLVMIQSGSDIAPLL